MEIKQFIDLYRPCHSAQRFLVTQDSLSVAWNNCERLDWLIWVASRFPELHNKLRLYKCAVVRKTPIHDDRTVWDLLTDDRSKNAVEVSERYSRGEATLEELEIDAVAADAVAAAADAVAADAVAAAADAVAYAVARAKSRKFQLGLFKNMFSFDEIDALLKERLAQVD